MARLRAVVTIHAPGLGGTPCDGHRAAATVNASWTASSAASISPRKRIRVATQRPYSRRKTASTVTALRWSWCGGGHGAERVNVGEHLPSLLRRMVRDIRVMLREQVLRHDRSPLFVIRDWSLAGPRSRYEMTPAESTLRFPRCQKILHPERPW